MIIHPYSNSNNFSSGGVWEPTADNFPIAHLYKFEEQTGAVTLTDSVGGANLDSGAVTRVGNGITGPGNSLPVFGNTLTAPGTSKVIAFIIADMSTGSPAFGSAATGGIFFTQSGAGGLDDGANALALTAWTANAASYGRLIATDWTTVHTYDCNNNATSSTKATVATSAAAPATIAGGIATFGQTVNLPATHTFYMAGLLYFTGTIPPPNSLLAGICWMTKQATAGNKWIYPGWKGLT